MQNGTRAVISSLDAAELQRILIQGCRALEAKFEAINALNVFPVPDGDTGTNMLLTMKALEAEAAKSTDIPASQLVATMAKGALLGARGNSGVILAQFFQGLAKGLNGKGNFDCRALALGLAEATTAAYKAVGNPVEGTMLTVIREVSEASQIQAVASADILELWEAMCLAARISVARTPSLLPVLREAGVVDAGGQGLSILLEGALKGLRGEEIEGIELTAPEMDTGQHGISEAFIEATEEELYGYCTQFLLQGEALDADAVREKMLSLATSTVVVGGDDMVKVHVHTKDPGPVLSYAVTLGTLSQVSIVNMDEQHQEFVAARRREQKVQPVGVLAVASGQGLMDIFLDSGASAVLSGGDTMNPSTQEILDAAEGIAAERVIVLTNNSNIVPAAEQASSISTRPMTVIPSRTIPQGIAALLAFNPDQDFETNVAAMMQSTSTVVSGAICAAQRDAELEGVKVAEGQMMGLLERQMVVAGDDRTAVLLDLIAKAGPEEGSLITLYWGADTLKDEVDEATRVIRSRFPGVEVEVAFGGQPHYNYIVSVE
ncbi:MAG: DAK2 domain-containing protein [Chloroflexi bacterium]|nr:DAK2 domain-containing protein [Chloroflexota bacterium]